jgi:uncharacterized protein GlcG (DUF336 family)
MRRDNARREVIMAKKLINLRFKKRETIQAMVPPLPAVKSLAKKMAVRPLVRGRNGGEPWWNPRFVLLALATAAFSIVDSQGTVAQTLATHRIPAALALEAVGEAVAACARQGYSETAVLVDVDGVRQAVLRGDRAGAHTLDSANDKAYTAASFKSDTSALVERAKTAPIAPLLAKLPNLLLFSGGLVIKMDDEVIGAIGAAGAPGGDLDDACARAGLDKIRDRLK